jgi:hypothetical protein
MPGLVLITAVVLGCGSRGPLDDYAYPVVMDAGDDGASLDAGPPEAAAPVDAGREAGPLDCGLCAIRSCGSTVLECVQSPPCRSVLQCAATTCFSGGLDTQCIFQCATDDPQGALGMLAIIQCVTSKCGSDCTSVIGGLGGLGGGGG